MPTCVPLTVRIWIVPLERNPARVSFSRVILRPPSIAPAIRAFSTLRNPRQTAASAASRKS